MGLPTTIDLLAEPRDAAYRELLAFAARQGFVASLVVRLPQWTDAACASLLATLRPCMIEESEATEWPGTQLLDGATATVRLYSLTEQCVDVLSASVSGLFEWQHPSRPEDLCILRSDRTPWLVSIAHEMDAYFRLMGEEREVLEQAIPQIGSMLAAHRVVF